MVYIMVSMSDIMLKEIIKHDPLQTLCNTFETGLFQFWEQLTLVVIQKCQSCAKPLAPAFKDATVLALSSS